MRGCLTPMAHSGGLAERAQFRIACRQTDFALWKRQTDSKAGPLSYDMQMRIVKVLYLPKSPSEQSRRTAILHPVLALCRLIKCRKPLASDLTLGTYVILFNLPPTPENSSISCTLDLFDEGMDVLVWMPWERIDVSSTGNVEIRKIFAQLDILNPPHSLLVFSRFYVLTPKQPVEMQSTKLARDRI